MPAKSSTGQTVRIVSLTFAQFHPSRQSDPARPACTAFGVERIAVETAECLAVYHGTLKLHVI